MVLCTTLLTLSWFVAPQQPHPLETEMPVLLPMRERAEIQDRWLGIRLESLIPKLMRREGIDTWLVISREYNEDPVFRSMAPPTWLSARRRTILMFHDPGPEQAVERLAISRYDVGRHFKGVWNKDEQPDQWQCLVDLLLERDPQSIAVNTSKEFALADGLSHGEWQALREALPEELEQRVVSGQALAIGWLETRIPEELEVYPTLTRIAHRIIAEGLSNRVVQPGHTTTEDVQWWYRDRIRELGLTTWFHPSVSLQRAASAQQNDESESTRVRRGDLLHVDFGIRYLGLHTDTQQHAYVLRLGEHEAPAGLRAGLKVGNELQDLLTAEFVTGRSGNEILRRTLARAKEVGIEALIYTHPLGFHGHGAGPLIGLWDQQDGVPGRGDYPLYPSTAHSIELSATVAVEEWGDREVRIMLEEDAWFDGERVRYLDGRQTRLLLIE